MHVQLFSKPGRVRVININSEGKRLMRFLLDSSSGHSLTQFVRHCADHFLNSEHKEIRMEAARTCSRLLTPSIHLINGHGHVVSQTAVQVVADVLSKLLVVGITDPGETDDFDLY